MNDNDDKFERKQLIVSCSATDEGRKDNKDLSSPGSSHGTHFPARPRKRRAKVSDNVKHSRQTVSGRCHIIKSLSHEKFARGEIITELIRVFVRR